MATASNATTSAGESSGSNVPQWKRDLIQRRRQQSKVLANNGASVKLCSAVIGQSSGTSTPSEMVVDRAGHRDQGPSGPAGPWTRSTILSDETTIDPVGCDGNTGTAIGENNLSGVAASSSGYCSGRGPSSGATVCRETCGASSATDGAPAVACNMRLEADLSLCSDSEDVANGTLTKSADMERKSEHGDGSENEDSRQETKRMDRGTPVGCEDRQTRGTCRTNKIERDVLAELSKARVEKIEAEMAKKKAASEDGESDSSEELQYGPGIVDKLKSKYLNLTLRETNKSRVSVQRFRRAASLEDLLDREDEAAGEKTTRKYAKRVGAGVTAKTERYRNASRGNESMKRARSVETLLRYNVPEEVGSTHGLAGRPASNGLGQEPVNDHIILVDRTSVKIESRLTELDRPKPLNKPKRIKPLLAETERPPPDLVKTTMRIFEGSAKRLKPKGEVAAKVATFKTINDTFKAQTQKKIVPKPPVQPKPFVNGAARPPSSPKKIALPRKPTAELIETQDGQEEYHIDGVITDPIVQSVSSVVSKFQQIEKAHSPSPSPEPSYKFKFSPVPSPEPPQSKLKSGLEINVKSPPVTPILSPRISSPRLQSPSSPLKEAFKQSVSPRLQSPPSPLKPESRRSSSPVRKLPPPSPSRETKPRILAQDVVETARPNDDVARVVAETTVEQIDRVRSSDEDEPIEESKPTEVSPIDQDDSEDRADGTKTISKSALDNIGRAGCTMQFSFGDKPTSTKSYLPGPKQNGQRSSDEAGATKQLLPESRVGKTFLSGAPGSPEHEAVSRVQERLEPVEKRERKTTESKDEAGGDGKTIESKPIGAISSLGLVKSSTTTSYSQGNESKTIRCQKSESSPPQQKQIGIIRPLVSTKTQHPQQNLSNRELEKNLINRVKSIEQPTKVVVSLKSAEEIQPAKKSPSGTTGLWDAKPWNQQNNTMVFNFSNRKDVPDYIENDGLIIKRKREKPKVGDGGIIVLDATLDASTTDDAEWELSGGPPSPCDVSFLNDNVLINGRSNLSRTPRNHKHRIQFDDTATRTFEYPSEASMLEGESSSVDGETSGSVEQQSPSIGGKTASTNSTTSMPTLLGGGGGGGLASYTPSKVDLTSEGFELGVTRAASSTPSSTSTSPTASSDKTENEAEVDYLKPAQDAGAWGSETTGDLLY